MGKVKKQTRKLRQKASNGDLRRMPKSATARANKRKRRERERVATAAEAMDDDEEVIEMTTPAPLKPVEEMDVDELIGAGRDDDSDEMAAHAAEMKALAETDPDFYKHLMEHNPDLLEFGNDDEINIPDDDDDNDEEDAGEDESDDVDEEEPATSVDLSKIVPALLRNACREKSQRSLKRLIRLFRVASHAADAEAEGEQAGTIANKSEADTAVETLRVADPAAFDRLLRALLKYVPGLLVEQLGADPKRSTHWKALESATRSFLGNAVHFVGQCVEPGLQRRTLRALSPALTLFTAFPKMCQRYLKVLLQIWSKGADQARIESFLQLRSLVQALRHRPAFVSAALRGLYGTFVRNAKFLTAVNAPMLRFMQNCIVEMFALDTEGAYQHAFVYLRQIAVRLRANATQIDAQLLNSVRLWSLVLARLAADPRSPLRPLCYPFVQIVLALIQSHASNKYFPLHLQCAEMLHDVCSVTGQYVPISTPLLGVICATNWAPVGITKDASTKATTKPPPIETMIAAPNSLLRSKAFQDAVVNRAVTMLRLHLTRHSRHIAFPELGAPVRRTLTKFASETKIVRFRKVAQKLAVQIASNMTFIESRRGDCDFSPKDREAIAAWSAALPKTPLEAYSESAGSHDSQPEPTPQLEEDSDSDENSSVDMDGVLDAAAESDDDQDQSSDGDSNAEDVVDDFVISSSDDDEEEEEDDSQ